MPDSIGRFCSESAALRTSLFLHRFTFMRHFYIHNQHLEAVFDIRETDIRVIIQRQNLRVRIQFFQTLDHAAPYHMIR